MRFIAVEQEAVGVIAIGQLATGVFALGQMATGVIAIGQVARGFVAIGQGAFGVFALGMGSVGLIGSIGMIGAGGRGFGLIFPLVPSLGPSWDLPETVSVRDARKGGGWIEARLEGSQLLVDGKRVDARFAARLRPAVEAATEPREVLALLARREDGVVCEKLMAVPAARWKSPGWWGFWAAQLAALTVACLLFWVLVGIPVVQALFNPGGILVR